MDSFRPLTAALKASLSGENWGDGYFRASLGKGHVAVTAIKQAGYGKLKLETAPALLVAGRRYRIEGTGLPDLDSRIVCVPYPYVASNSPGVAYLTSTVEITGRVDGPIDRKGRLVGLYFSEADLAALARSGTAAGAAVSFVQ